MNGIQKVLFVDDEVNILQAMRRQLRGKFQVEVAGSGAEALKLFGDSVQQGSPFAVVISDMQMPQMNGLELLKRIRELHAETVRIMLTGNADQQTAINAVNEGRIFRFLNKPITADQLSGAIAMGLEHYDLLHSERVLLTQTLQGAVHLVTDILGLVHPEAFGANQAARRLARTIAIQLKFEPLWTIELAAMLSSIGWVAIPDSVVHDHLHGHPLNPEQRKQFDQHPKIGAALLSKIPRLEPIADLIQHQLDPSGSTTPLGAKILRVVNEYQRLTLTQAPANAIERLKSAPAIYDRQVVEALANAICGSTVTVNAEIDDLREGMVLANPVVTSSGEILLRAESEVTGLVIERLKNFARSARGVRTPLLVRKVQTEVPVPISDELPLPEPILAWV